MKTYVKTIKEICADEYGVTVELMESTSRLRLPTMARQIAMVLILERRVMPVKCIGNLFGGRDHRTVYNSKKVVKDLLSYDKAFKKIWKTICERIQREESL